MILDEFGFDRIERTESPQAASLLYKLITRGADAFDGVGDEHRFRGVGGVPGRSAAGDGVSGPDRGWGDHREDQRQVVSSPPGTASLLGQAIKRVNHQPEPVGQTSPRAPADALCRALIESPRREIPSPAHPATSPVAQSWPPMWLNSWPRSTQSVQRGSPSPHHPPTPVARVGVSILQLLEVHILTCDLASTGHIDQLIAINWGGFPSCTHVLS